MPFDIFEELLKYLVKSYNNSIIFFRVAFGNIISEVRPALPNACFWDTKYSYAHGYTSQRQFFVMVVSFTDYKSDANNNFEVTSL